MPGGEQIDNHEEETLGPTLSFGNYHLLEPIGERGGMGVVHRAIQMNPRREVALKRIKTGIDATEEHIARFKIEVESVANFQHPNIVRVFEFGEHDGELFYSMPLVKGGSLHRKLRDEQRLSCHSAAKIIRTVADALAYAHQRKIIHRDLKPPNILFDDAQNPMIIDFGCAKRLEPDADEGLTIAGFPIGTWRYMPPEQLERPGEADERSDIFSLGAVLYECLVGRSLHQAADPLEIIRLLEDPTFEPPKPREIHPEIDRDLEAICLKCVKWDPGQRYEKARELFDDLDRYLRGEAPSVRPLTPVRRLVSWCRKNRAIASALATVVLVVTPISLFVNQLLISKNAELESKNAEVQRTSDERDSTINERDSTIKELDSTIKELDSTNAKLDRATRIANERRYIDRIREADRARNALRLAEANQILDSMNAEIEDLDQMVQFEWDYLRQVTNTDRHAIILTHTEAVRCVAVAPDGTELFFSDSRGDLYVAKVNGQSWAIQENPSRTFDDGIADIAFGRQSRQLVVGTETRGQLHLFTPPRDNRPRNNWPRTVNEKDPITQVALVPNGDYVVAATESGLIGMYNEIGNSIVDTGNSNEQPAHDGVIYALDVGFIHDTLCIVSGGHDGKVKIWQFDNDVLTERDFIAIGSVIPSLAVCPERNRIAVGTQDGRLHQWQVNADLEFDSGSSVLVGHKNPLYSVAYNRQGDQLVTAGEDGVVRFWNPQDLSLREARPGHNGPVYDVSFLCTSPAPDAETSELPRGIDGDRCVVSVGEDKTLRIWKPDATGDPLRDQRLTLSRIEALCFSKDGQRILSANGDNQIAVWDVEKKKLLFTFGGHQSAVAAICVEPESGRLASLDVDGRIRLWTEPEEVASLDSPPVEFSQIDAKAKSIAFTPDGSGLAALTADGQLVIYDLDDLSPGTAKTFHGIRELVSTADSLFATFDDGSMRAIVDGEVRRDRANPFQVGTQEEFAISRNGSRWIRLNAGQVELWASLSQTRILNLTTDDEDDQKITRLAFSPDGQMISCGDSLGNIWVWGATER